jgi:hypothetical protein
MSARRSDERVRLVERLDRDPSQRAPIGSRANGSRQVRIGLADALERDPLVLEPGPPCDRPLTTRDDVRVEPERSQPRDDGCDVVRLDGERAQPWVRKGVSDGGSRGLQRRLVGDLDRRAEPRRSAPEGRREPRQVVDLAQVRIR